MRVDTESKTSTKLAREDWDFRPVKNGYAGCSEEQLFDCFEYEYSRQYALIHHHAPKTKLYDDRLRRFYAHFEGYFPATAWLLIPEEVRKNNRAQLESEFPEFQGVFRVAKAGLNQRDIKNGVVDRVGVGRSGIVHVTVVPLAISWQFSNGELVDAFAKWIEDNQPKKSNQCKIKTSGTDERKAMRIALNWLGALRILDSVGLERRDEFLSRYDSDKRGKPVSLYGSRASTWSAAANEVRRIIAGWSQPMTMFLSEQPGLERELLGVLSLENSKERNGAPLDDWMLRRATLSVARRFLVRSKDKLLERLKIVCERPSDGAALDILGHKLMDHWES